MLRSRWVVLLVTQTESDAALYMRPLGRPRKEKVEGKQETKQASKAGKRKEETTEEEEEQEPAHKEGSVEVEDDKRGHKRADR